MIAPVSKPGALRLHALDMLRGLCAVAVAVGHFKLWANLGSSPIIDGIGALFVTYGVSIFFILSGYSLAHAYGEQFNEQLEARRVLRFFQRRIGRLAPLFCVVVLLSWAGRVAAGGNVPDPLSLLANVSLLFGTVAPADTPVIGGWSIGVEAVFYLLFPLMMLLRREQLYVVVAAVFLTVWISVDLVDQPSLAAGWNAYVAPANHFVFFAVGAFMRLWSNARPALSPVQGIPLLLAIALCICWIAAGASELELVTGWRRVALVSLSLLIVAVLGRMPLDGRAAWASAILGGLSYPLYLIHPLLFFALQGRISIDAVAVGCVFALAILLALCADRVVDQPVQRRLKAAGW